MLEITRACEGCMYGSYPEMTIAMRFLAAKLQRVKNFLTSPPAKKWPVTYEQLLSLAERIGNEPRERPKSRQPARPSIKIASA